MPNLPAMSRNMDHCFRFMGYGDIEKARIWFIGIEPGGEGGINLGYDSEGWRLLDIPHEQLWYDPQLPREKDNKVVLAWSLPREISEKAGNGEHYFLSNMAPWPCPNTDEEYKKEINGAVGDYPALVKNLYLPRLRKAYERYAPQAVVFHGVGVFEKYGIASVFCLSASQKTEGIQCFESKKAVLWNNFSPRNHHLLLPEELDKMIRILKTWLR